MRATSCTMPRAVAPLPPPTGRSRPMYSRTQASLSKPAELNPPAKGQEEFAKKFGITWKAALEKGVVYNAVDGCKRLGVDGVVMDKTWVTLLPPPLLLPFAAWLRTPVD